MSPLEFLNFVLPAEGIRCGSTNILRPKPEKSIWRDFFFETNEEMLAFLRREQTDKDVYFCTATFENKESRKTENVRLRKVLHIDLDGVEDYGSVDAGRAAFEKFLNGSGWPEPGCVVGSGGGFHYYWVLDVPLGVERWREAAQSLRDACDKHGLKVNGGITIDPVRVLRLPGSFNHKPERNGARVELLHYTDREFHLSDLPISRGVHNGTIKGGNRPGDGGSSRFILPHKPDLVDFKPVYGGCAQVRHFAETGLEGEPGWWTLSGLFTYIKDGDALFHKFSSIAKEYDYAQAQGKLDARRKNATGPVTCKTIRSGGRPFLCDRCPSFGCITSPAELRGSGLSNANGANAGDGDGGENRIYNGGGSVGVSNTGDLPTLPHQFSWDTDGALIFNAKEKNGGALTISSLSLFLVRRGRDVLSTDHFDEFIYRDPLEGPRSIRVRSADVSGPGAVSLMAKHGVSIQSAEYFRLYVARARDMLAREQKTEVQHDQFGWKDDASFLYGRFQFSNRGISGSSICEELQERANHLRAGGSKSIGSLGAWSSSVRGLLQSGFEPQQVALLASAAAPLVNFIDDADGGAIIHFVSRVSGAGKTSALEIAASLWGDYAGLLVAMDDTRNFRSSLFGSLCHLPILFNELVERDVAAVESLVRLFSGGRGRGRCDQRGKIIENPHRWSTFLLSTANRSLKDPIIASGNTDAMASRILEFEMEPIRDAALIAAGERYKKGVKENCGWAGQELIKAYVSLAPGVLKEAVASAYGEVLQMYPKWGGDQRYRARILGCLMVAGYFMDRLHLIEFNVDRLIKWVGDKIESERSADVPDRKLGSEALSTFLNEHVQSTLAVDRDAAGNIFILRQPVRELLVRKEAHTNLIFIDRMTLLKWLSSRDVMTKPFMDRMFECGTIEELSKAVSLGDGTPFAGGAVGCIVVNSKRLK